MLWSVFKKQSYANNHFSCSIVFSDVLRVWTRQEASSNLSCVTSGHTVNELRGKSLDLIWFTSPCATASLFLFSCYAPVNISVSSQRSWVKDWWSLLTLTVASNLSLCVFRCGVWRQDDHYRWKTDQTADLGYGKMSLVPLFDVVNVNVPVRLLEYLR